MHAAWYNSTFMLLSITAALTWLQAFVRTRHDLALEIVVLRQQVIVLKRRTKRPRLQCSDRVFWVLLRRCWPNWAKSLLIVKPETVIAWHRQGFRHFWRFRSRRKTAGRAKTPISIRSLIRLMRNENFSWGAPRIQLKLGVQVSERTVSRYLAYLRRNGDAGQRWRTFLSNHRQVIAGMDFFTVITANFRILLLVLDSTRPPGNHSPQLHRASYRRVDHAAASGSVSGSHWHSVRDLRS